MFDERSASYSYISAGPLVWYEGRRRTAGPWDFSLGLVGQALRCQLLCPLLGPTVPHSTPLYLTVPYSTLLQQPSRACPFFGWHPTNPECHPRGPGWDQGPAVRGVLWRLEKCENVTVFLTWHLYTLELLVRLHGMIKFCSCADIINQSCNITLLEHLLTSVRYSDRGGKGISVHNYQCHLEVY